MIKKLLLLFNLLLGSIIVLYTLYVRFIVVRLPRELYINSSIGLKYSLIILITISTSICISQILVSILTIYKYQIKEGTFSRITSKITNIVDTALFELYAFLTAHIPDIYDYISYISERFYVKFHKKEEIFFLLFLYGIRSIIVIAFLIDVFIYFRLEYMYYTLYLLSLSVLVKLLFYILRDFAGNVDELRSYLIIEDKGIDKETGLPITIYSAKDLNDIPFLEYYISQYILCNKLSGYLHMYDRYSHFFTPYFNLIIYTGYSIGWFYVIFMNL